ncbi:MAG: hypothetical protein M5U34_21970 [Chloroflexi bacterium]|nr:hypothetical protein [Chloroflexota bacterium]
MRSCKAVSAWAIGRVRMSALFGAEVWPAWAEARDAHNADDQVLLLVVQRSESWLHAKIKSSTISGAQ